MKVLILSAPGDKPPVEELTASMGDLSIIQGEDVPGVPKDPAQVDVIIGCGDCSPGSALNDSMLGWRVHPHTYLIPCWFEAEKKVFEQNGIWPRLAIDRFDLHLRAEALSEWLPAVSEWQQNRMHFNNNGSLETRSALELATSLYLRRASGALSVIDKGGAEGIFLFRDGNLISAVLEHLRGNEAFYEFLCMSYGWYTWESKTNLPSQAEPQSISHLIAAGLQKIQDAHLLFYFVTDFDCTITKTESQSSLDDSATVSFQEQKQLYALIEENVAVSQIIQSSPLSRPSTMAVLAKWFSLEDITIGKTHAESRCRVLVVDDSPLICRALQTIFAEDPRIELAGVAHDGMEALRLISGYKPDVVTLDLQMPKMDGLTALKHIMIRNPTPVVVVSAFTRETSRLTYEAFRYGAVDVLAKPSGNDTAVRELGARELRDRVAQAARVRIDAARYIRRRPNAAGAPARPNGNGCEGEGADFLIVVCGAGGFSLLLKVFFALSGLHEAPSVVCSTTLSAGAVQALVPCLAADCGLAVTSFCPPGGALAPRTSVVGSREHPFRPVEANGGISVEIVETKGPVRPFDALLSGAAELFGKRAVALLISGEGEDGLDGMRRIREVGGRAFVLSPEMCLKQDLPRKILLEGCAVELKTVSAIVARLAACPREACGATAGNSECESHAVQAT